MCIWYGWYHRLRDEQNVEECYFHKSWNETEGRGEEAETNIGKEGNNVSDLKYCSRFAVIIFSFFKKIKLKGKQKEER